MCVCVCVFVCVCNSFCFSVQSEKIPFRLTLTGRGSSSPFAVRQTDALAVPWRGAHLVTKVTWVLSLVSHCQALHLDFTVDYAGRILARFTWMKQADENNFLRKSHAASTRSLYFFLRHSRLFHKRVTSFYRGTFLFEKGDEIRHSGWYTQKKLQRKAAHHCRFKAGCACTAFLSATVKSQIFIRYSFSYFHIFIITLHGQRKDQFVSLTRCFTTQ